MSNTLALATVCLAFVTLCPGAPHNAVDSTTIVPEDATQLTFSEQDPDWHRIVQHTAGMPPLPKASTAGEPPLPKAPTASGLREPKKSMPSKLQHHKCVGFDDWPDYAKKCQNQYGAYACKPPIDAGGCTSCTPGWVYGASVSCSDKFAGEACDFGPSNCGKSVCFEDSLKADVRKDKSLILSALEMSAVSYVVPEDAPGRESVCPGLDNEVGLQYEHYPESATRISWGVAHKSFGQRGGDKLYVIAFRGTASETATTFGTNWMTNLKLYGADMDGAVVHSGFLDALLPHKDELMVKILKVAAQGHRRILITGHSLGAGLANIFAYFVMKAHPSLKVELITAGGPRVGDYKFVDFMEKSASLIYRVNAWCDPIPQTPEQIYFDMGMVSVIHAGPQITVGANFNCWSDPMRIITVAAHDITLYIKRVRHEIKGPGTSLCGNSTAMSHAEATELFSFEKSH